MEAGRELDRLVAEKVMGLSFDAEPPIMLIPREYPWTVPHFSTDIAAASQVLEKLADRFGYVDVRVARHGITGVPLYYASLDAGQEDLLERAGDSSPHAICLLALAAVEVPTH